MDKLRAPASRSWGDKQKKPYRPPKLEVYGDIRQITQNRQNSSTIDGGSRVPRGTHIPPGGGKIGHGG